MKKRHAGSFLFVVVLGIGLWLVSGRVSGELRRQFAPLPSETTPPVAVAIESPVAPSEPLLMPSEEPQSRFRPAPPLLALHEDFFQTLEPLASLQEFRYLVPHELLPAVNFWRKIYSVYTSRQVVLHDMEDLAVEYGVLDFSSLEDEPITDVQKQLIRERRIAEMVEKIRAGLDEEKASNVRAQGGLRDKFEKAIRLSGRYFPVFEQAFAAHGLPLELTRLVLVESLLQPRALSKVGAGGFWQFMPGTARLEHLQVSRVIDERYDPIVASHAAASLLRKNFEALGSWPLAITAYNTGVGQIRRAVQSLGSRDIADIVTRYRSDAFGFASRNFYAEFLAALEVFEHSERYFGAIRKEDPFEFRSVSLPISATMPQIAFLCDASLDQLEELNPAFAHPVFEGHYTLSAGAQIRIPQDKGDLFAARFLQYYSPGRLLPVSHARNELAHQRVSQ